MQQKSHHAQLSTSNIQYIIILLVVSISAMILCKVGITEKVYIAIFNLLFVNMGKEKKGEGEKNKEQWLESFTPEDAILILLYAQKEKPITGKLMFVKQLFLLSQEVIPEIKDKLKFFAYNFGPYSQIFAKTMNKLIEEKLVNVEVSQIEDQVLYRFCLSDEGKIRGEQSFNKLPDGLKDIIIRKRRGWDQLGYTGMVRLVYTKYPEYIVASTIKDEVNE